MPRKPKTEKTKRTRTLSVASRAESLLKRRAEMVAALTAIDGKLDVLRQEAQAQADALTAVALAAGGPMNLAAVVSKALAPGFAMNVEIGLVAPEGEAEADGGYVVESDMDTGISAGVADTPDLDARLAAALVTSPGGVGSFEQSLAD